MAASSDFVSFLVDELSPLGHVTVRRMFGKTGVFCEGVMLGMVAEDVFYVRVDTQSRATFKEAESAPSLSYVKNGATINLSFWRVPDRLFDEHDELIAWARAALASAHRVAAKSGRTKGLAARGRPPGNDQAGRRRAQA
jgi:DNA transformation protein and related proteins